MKLAFNIISLNIYSGDATAGNRSRRIYHTTNEVFHTKLAAIR